MGTLRHMQPITETDCCQNRIDIALPFTLVGSALSFSFMLCALIMRGSVSIHGLVYDIADGKLKELGVDLQGYCNKHSHIYQLYQKNPDM